jgi:hypothetical protein
MNKLLAIQNKLKVLGLSHQRIEVCPQRLSMIHEFANTWCLDLEGKGGGSLVAETDVNLPTLRYCFLLFVYSSSYDETWLSSEKYKTNCD